MGFEVLRGAAIFHQYLITCNFELLMSKEVGDWVKARSTTWYSNFLMKQYDNKRWVEHFQITKEIVLQLIEKFNPLIKKRDTTYINAIHVGIKVVNSLYKLSHGVEYLQCNELFAIRKSLVNMVLYEFVLLTNFAKVKLGGHEGMICFRS
jgi:hypothetical protein